MGVDDLRGVDAVERARNDLVRCERWGECGVETWVEEPESTRVDPARTHRTEHHRGRQHSEHPPARNAAEAGVHSFAGRSERAEYPETDGEHEDRRRPMAHRMVASSACTPEIPACTAEMPPFALIDGRPAVKEGHFHPSLPSGRRAVPVLREKHRQTGTTATDIRIESARQAHVCRGGAPGPPPSRHGRIMAGWAAPDARGHPLWLH